jgi:hypothetical protein
VKFALAGPSAEITTAGATLSQRALQRLVEGHGPALGPGRREGGFAEGRAARCYGALLLPGDRLREAEFSTVVLRLGFEQGGISFPP